MNGMVGPCRPDLYKNIGDDRSRSVLTTLSRINCSGDGTRTALLRRVHTKEREEVGI